MNLQQLKNKCAELSRALGIEQLNSLTLEEYYSQFRDLTETRFDEIIEYLKTNTQYKRFPLIWDFIQAQWNTHKENSYTQFPREKYEDEFVPIKKAFKIMDRIRNMVCKPLLGLEYFGEPTKKTYQIMKQFYAEKIQNKQVFSIKNNNWIIQENAVSPGGDYFNPLNLGLDRM